MSTKCSVMSLWREYEKYQLTGVSPLVDLEIFGSGKNFATLRPVAGERFLSCVDPDMVYEFVFCFEWLSVPWTLQPKACMIIDLWSTDMFDCDVSHDLLHRREQSITGCPERFCFWIFLIDPHAGNCSIRGCGRTSGSRWEGSLSSRSVHSSGCQVMKIVVMMIQMIQWMVMWIEGMMRMVRVQGVKGCLIRWSLVMIGRQGCLLMWQGTSPVVDSGGRHVPEEGICCGSGMRSDRWCQSRYVSCRISGAHCIGCICRCCCWLLVSWRWAIRWRLVQMMASNRRGSPGHEWRSRCCIRAVVRSNCRRWSSTRWWWWIRTRGCPDAQNVLHDDDYQQRLRSTSSNSFLTDDETEDETTSCSSLPPVNDAVILHKTPLSSEYSLRWVLPKMMLSVLLLLAVVESMYQSDWNLLLRRPATLLYQKNLLLFWREDDLLLCVPPLSPNSFRISAADVWMACDSGWWDPASSLLNVWWLLTVNALGKKMMIFTLSFDSTPRLDLWCGLWCDSITRL